jgi:hypothetical protein
MLPSLLIVRLNTFVGAGFKIECPKLFLVDGEMAKYSELG